jgi:two-component system, OmpR family, phosphate regulon sensor histidine kinase PhoR
LNYYGITGTAVALCVLLIVLRPYITGIVRLHAGLRRVARENLDLPLMLDLPRGLRSAERDLKAIASRTRDLERAASSERFGLAAVLASIAEGVFIVDTKMKIRLGNTGLEKMFGLAVSPAGRTLMETFRNLDIQRLVEGALRDGRSHRGEIAVDEGRSFRTFDFSVSPLRLEDGETGAVVVIHNITKIKSLERVRREFVANVSHELRTPLTIINGYLETLLEGGLEDRVMAENALGVMFRHSERLKHLTDDLLVISQAESRSVPLDLQQVELRDLIRRVVAQFDKPIRAQGTEIRITTADKDLAVEADAVKLEQVCVNLLDNALKYGNRPGLTVEFYAERLGSKVHLRISDNGPGIPYEDQEHIFERFYRVHKDRARHTGGTGLGLSIVKNVVEAHGGEVSLQSIPGSGSVFHLILPADQSFHLSTAA